MSKFIPFITILVFIPSFLVQMNSCQNRVELEEDDLIKKHFSSQEIKELEKILSFVDKRILSAEISDREISDREICNLYQDKWWKRRNQIVPSGFNFIDLEEQLKLFEKISPKLFNKLWAFDFCLTKNNGSKGKREIHNNIISTIEIQLLEEMADNSGYMKKTYDNYRGAGSQSPSLCAFFYPKWKDDFDFHLDRVRLILSIDLLIFNIERINHIQEPKLENKFEQIIKNKRSDG